MVIIMNGHNREVSMCLIKMCQCHCVVVIVVAALIAGLVTAACVVVVAAVLAILVYRRRWVIESNNLISVLTYNNFIVGMLLINRLGEKLPVLR